LQDTFKTIPIIAVRKYYNVILIIRNFYDRLLPTFDWQKRRKYAFHRSKSVVTKDLRNYVQYIIYPCQLWATDLSTKLDLKHIIITRLYVRKIHRIERFELFTALAVRPPTSYC
jgi:hypothetical protein